MPAAQNARRAFVIPSALCHSEGTEESHAHSEILHCVQNDARIPSPQQTINFLPQNKKISDKKLVFPLKLC